MIVDQGCHKKFGYGKLPRHIDERDINRYLASLTNKSKTPSLGKNKWA